MDGTDGNPGIKVIKCREPSSSVTDDDDDGVCSKWPGFKDAKKGGNQGSALELGPSKGCWQHCGRNASSGWKDERWLVTALPGLTKLQLPSGN